MTGNTTGETGREGLFAIGLIMAVFSIALALWEQRVLVFGLFAAVFIGTALLLVVSLRAQARKPSRLFRSSLSELDEDIAQLRGRPQE